MTLYYDALETVTAPTDNRMARRRLLRLAKYLQRPVLGVSRFNFNVVYGEYDNYSGDCGSCGCALGCCTFAFKELKAFPHGTFDRSECLAGKFFDLDDRESAHLFLAGNQKPLEYGGKELSSNATALEVAENIIAFVNKKYPQRKKKG